MKLQTKTIALLLLLLASCRGKKETAVLYTWKGQDESRTLTLTKEGTFILDISAGYFSRTDTGTYAIKGDTLIINPEKKRPRLDSLAVVDSLFNGARFVEVLEEEVTVERNEVTESFYRAKIFPVVYANDTLPLALHPDDAAFSKLLVPDSLAVARVHIALPVENTCRPVVPVATTIPGGERSGKSYRIYLRSLQRKENYLAGYKWLIRGDTLEMFFSNEDCAPTDVKLVRE